MLISDIKLFDTTGRVEELEYVEGKCPISSLEDPTTRITFEQFCL